MQRARAELVVAIILVLFPMKQPDQQCFDRRRWNVVRDVRLFHEGDAQHLGAAQGRTETKNPRVTPLECTRGSLERD
jgi:hypothetical protein